MGSRNQGQSPREIPCVLADSYYILFFLLLICLFVFFSLQWRLLRTSQHLPAVSSTWPLPRSSLQPFL